MQGRGKKGEGNEVGGRKEGRKRKNAGEGERREKGMK